MRYILLALVLGGCGDAAGDVQPVPPAKVTISAGDPMACRLDADGACHCTILEYSLQAIADMGDRCNFLRGVAGDLY
jgi:hypothetical protein